jgi:hypothetical protein
MSGSKLREDLKVREAYLGYVSQRSNRRMPSSRFIRLTEDEDARLREIEQDPYLKPKVRLRVQVVQLSHRGSNMDA